MQQWLQPPGADDHARRPASAPAYAEAKAVKPPNAAPQGRRGAVKGDRARIPPVGQLPALDLADDQPHHAVERHPARLRAAHRGAADPGGAVVRRRRRRRSAGRRGLAGITMSLLDEGADELTSQQIAEAEERLGAEYQHRQRADRSIVTLSALSPNLAPSLDLLADIVQRAGLRARRGRPRPGPGADRHRADEKDPTAGRRARAARRDLRGDPSLWRARPAAIRRRSPSSPATIWSASSSAGCGRTTSRSSSSPTGRWPKCSRCSKRGSATGRRPPSPRASRAFRRRRRVRPRRRSCWSTARARRSRPSSAASSCRSTRSGDIVPFDTANEVLGGNFLSRLNMDLRETKGWSYGVSGNAERARQRRALHGLGAGAGGPHRRIRWPRSTSRLGEFLTTKGVTQEELERDGRQQHQRSCRASSRPRARCSSAMMRNDLLGRPDNYYETLAAQVSRADRGVARPGGARQRSIPRASSGWSSATRPRCGRSSRSSACRSRWSSEVAGVQSPSARVTWPILRPGRASPLP